MAQWAVLERSATVKLACQAFGISQTCYRYKAKLVAENILIADWLVRLTNNQRNWGFGLCFLYMRNVKGFKWPHRPSHARRRSRRRRKFDYRAQLGVVSRLGGSPVRGPDGASVQSVPVDLRLRPNPSGRRFWTQAKPFLDSYLILAKIFL